MKLDFSEYGKDEENREAIKKRLIERNDLFREVVELYERVLRDEKGPGMIIVAPLERLPSCRIKAIIDSVVDGDIESTGYPKNPMVVEPLTTIYDELHQIKGTARCEFKISDETRRYLENHPEVKLCRVKVRERWNVRRSMGKDTHEKEYFLFGIEESDLGERIQDRQSYIHLSDYSPVRSIHIDVLEVEQLDLKCLDDLVE